MQRESFLNFDDSRIRVRLASHDNLACLARVGNRCLPTSVILAAYATAIEKVRQLPIVKLSRMSVFSRLARHYPNGASLALVMTCESLHRR